MFRPSKMTAAAVLLCATLTATAQDPVPGKVVIEPIPAAQPQTKFSQTGGGFTVTRTVNGQSTSIKKEGVSLTFKGDRADLPAVLTQADKILKQDGDDLRDAINLIGKEPIIVEKTTVVTVPAPATGGCCNRTGVATGCACANQGVCEGPFPATYCRCAPTTVCNGGAARVSPRGCHCHRIPLVRCTAPTTLVCPDAAVTWFYHDYQTVRYYFYVDNRGNYYYWWRATWTRYPYQVTLVP